MSERQLWAQYRIVKVRPGEPEEWAEYFGRCYATREDADAALQGCYDEQLEMAEWAKIEDSIPFSEKLGNEMSYDNHHKWKGYEFRIVTRDVTEWRALHPEGSEADWFCPYWGPSEAFPDTEYARRLALERERSEAAATERQLQARITELEGERDQAVENGVKALRRRDEALDELIEKYGLLDSAKAVMAVDVHRDLRALRDRVQEADLDDRCACGSTRRYCGVHFTPAGWVQDDG